MRELKSHGGSYSQARLVRYSIVANYQINIKRYMSGSYIKSFFDIESKDLIELFVMANKLNDGSNKNEVQLVSKSKENRGFFEKFFQLFS